LSQTTPEWLLQFQWAHHNIIY